MTQYTTKSGLMISSEGNFQQNPDGSWSEAVPMPFYGPLGMKQCKCGKHFWRESTYQGHYRQLHTNGKTYKRTPKGMIEL